MGYRYVIVSFVVLGLLSARADPPVADGRAPVVVLPVEADGPVSPVSMSAIERLGDALVRAVEQSAGFVPAAPPQAVKEDTACRRDLGCLFAHLPAGSLVLDLRVSRPEGESSLVVYDLRLLSEGRLLSRTSASATARELERTVAEAGALLLAPHRLEATLYRQALEGDAEARARLLDRYPDGPWTRTILSTEIPADPE